MNFDKKYIAGIAAVAIAGVYSVLRWRSGSSDDDADEELSASSHPAPTAD
jgi:hypothetical protein